MNYDSTPNVVFYTTHLLDVADFPNELYDNTPNFVFYTTHLLDVADFSNELYDSTPNVVFCTTWSMMTCRLMEYKT